MKLRFVATVIIASLVGASSGLGQDGKLEQEFKKFEGVWRLESLKIGGSDAPTDKFQNTQVKFKGAELHVTRPAGEDIKGKFTLDPNSTPALIDVEVEMDGNQVTLEGIYKFEEGDLILCVNINPSIKERPAEFKSPEGSTIVLEVLRRVDE